MANVGRLARAEQIAPPTPGANGEFARAVAASPDLTGDGVPELIIGAWKETPATQPAGAGAAYVYQAHTGQLVRTLLSSSPANLGNFGSAVASVPDVTGDGVADILVGARRETPPSGTAGAGTVHVFNGATGALIRILGSTNQINQGAFGGALAGVPDLTGDGRGEILVGASAETVSANTQAGRAYLFNGASGAVLQVFTAPGASLQAGAAFGAAVAAVPDLTGDGIADLAIGAPLEHISTTADAGKVYVYNGATRGLFMTIQSPGVEAFGTFGCAVAGVADLNNDGLGDLLVGACGETSGVAASGGRAHLCDGATGGLIRTLVSPAPETVGFFGYALAAVPDVSGDGKPELLIGANNETPPAGSNRAGRAHLFNGATGALIRSLSSPNQDANGQFGGAVDGSADLNADGAGELIIGAPLENPAPAPTNSGMAYVFNGSTGAVLVLSPTPTPSLTPSLSPTASPSATPTATVSSTPSATASATPTASGTPTGSATPTASESPTETPSESPTQTPSSTQTPTSTASPTAGQSASRDWSVYE